MAGLVPAIHFPEAVIVLRRLWKMDPRHKAGDDGLGLMMRTRSKRKKKPLFSDGYGLGAVRELERMYGGTVTVSSKCFCFVLD